MPPPIAVSKTKLMSCRQCPRKLWLEQYNPELEQTGEAARSAIAAGLEVGEIARRVYGAGSGLRIGFERGLRSAVERTSEALAAGGSEPLFEATFDFEGLTVMTDVFDRTEGPRLVEVKASTQVKQHYYDDCAIQAWTLRELGVEVGSVALAHVNGNFSYGGGGNYDGLFTEVDITQEVDAHIDGVPALLARTRETLHSLDEPQIAIGAQCRKPHVCGFIEHCTPEQGRYPVAGLGGTRSRIDEWINAGYSDLRDVPEEELANESQRRIWQQTCSQRAFIDSGLAEFERTLDYPRYYLDFETIAFAVPRWPGTHPYEALPFQWSCHIDAGEGESLGHREFLDLSGKAPMRECADRLIDTLGDRGPVLVYTGYERRVIDGLADRFEDLADALHAISERLVDLHPVTKANYYHPDMLGSWSLKSVLPTLPGGPSFTELGDVRDGSAAQTAYLEAIDPETSDERREKIRHDLAQYCRCDTLALVALVRFFSEPLQSA